MGIGIGIDLGTTNTAVAVLENGRPKVLEDEKGYKVLPSCVSIKGDGNFVVGQAARALLLTEPSKTVSAVKRLLGRRYDSTEAELVRQRSGFEILPAPDGGCLVSMGGQTFSPIEISALVLQVSRSIAEKHLNQEVTEAVITVPAYFNHAQRSATLEAAQLAGLPCERLLNEPTAAALAYGFRHNEDKTLLIYDLGGGTFDVTVLRSSGDVYEILATKGDTFLGGEDFDFRLVDHLAEQFEASSGVNVREHPEVMQRLKDAAERTKCELSFSDKTTVLVPQLMDEHSLELVVSRLTLESLTEDLVERTLEVVEKTVGESGLAIEDVEDVIMVGGQTRMPRIQEAIGELFGRMPSKTVHPDEAVAIGAAVHANALANPDEEAAILIDVTPYDLGIDVLGGLFQTVIGRNTHVPTSETQTFATAKDGQEVVLVTVRQGESRVAKENEFMGEFLMTGLTSAPRMETKVDVTFRLNTNGILHVSAVEQGTGEKKEIVVRNYAQVAEGGGVKPSLEGDVASPADVRHIRETVQASSTKTAALAAVMEDGAPASAGKGKGKSRGGLFGKLLRRKKSAPAAAEVPVEPVEADGLPEAPPSIELPDVDEDALPEGLIDGLDDVAADEGAVLAELESAEETPARVEIAGGGLESLTDTDEDALEPEAEPEPEPEPAAQDAEVLDEAVFGYPDEADDPFMDDDEPDEAVAAEPTAEQDDEELDSPETSQEPQAEESPDSFDELDEFEELDDLDSLLASASAEADLEPGDAALSGAVDLDDFEELADIDALIDGTAEQSAPEDTTPAEEDAEEEQSVPEAQFTLDVEPDDDSDTVDETSPDESESAMDAAVPEDTPVATGFSFSDFEDEDDDDDAIVDADETSEPVPATEADGESVDDSPSMGFVMPELEPLDDDDGLEEETVDEPMEEEAPTPSTGFAMADLGLDDLEPLPAMDDIDDSMPVVDTPDPVEDMEFEDLTASADLLAEVELEEVGTEELDDLQELGIEDVDIDSLIAETSMEEWDEPTDPKIESPASAAPTAETEPSPSSDDEDWMGEDEDLEELPDDLYGDLSEFDD